MLWNRKKPSCEITCGILVKRESLGTNEADYSRAHCWVQLKSTRGTWKRRAQRIGSAFQKIHWVSEEFPRNLPDKLR